MRVPDQIVKVFQEPLSQSFRRLMSKIGHTSDDLESSRFLRRSIAPHIQKFSDRFNRIGDDKEGGVDPQYWSDRANPKNYRLAYLLYYMPPHAFQAAAIWAELHRLGYSFAGNRLHGLELGAGPGSGTTGIVAASSCLGRESWNFTLIDRDSGIMKMGCDWLRDYSESLGTRCRLKSKTQELDWSKPLLPRDQKFDVIILSYFFNESESRLEEIGLRLHELLDHHLNRSGILIVLDSALKFQSRKLLLIRQQLIDRSPHTKILTPCLGNQNCGALASEDDWCHEVAQWWRPAYFQKLDKELGMKHIDLPFSYFVATRSSNELKDLLPTLNPSRIGVNLAKEPQSPLDEWQRIISPVRKISKKKSEIYVCGESGKRQIEVLNDSSLERGDVISANPDGQS